MQIDKQQILQFLQQQGNQDQRQQADQELPQQVDTDDPQHQNLLQKLGINPQDLVTKLAGGKFGL